MAEQRENLEAFATFWLHGWRLAGGYIGIVDGQLRLGLGEPHKAVLVKRLRQMRDEEPGRREAIQAELETLPLFTIHE
jgi:hypothetical protein